MLGTGNQPNERVLSYNYLGCMVNEQEDHNVEIRCRIEQERSVFIEMNYLLCICSLNLETRCRLVQYCVYSILLCGIESWTLTKTK